MTFLAHLRTTASGFARSAAGLALGAGLFAALASGAPVPAFAAVHEGGHEATASGPRLWVVRDADSTLYLYGTVHVLRPETQWRSAAVDAAFDSASEVWFEIDNPDDTAAITPLIQQHGISPQRPLSSLLTPEELAALDAAARTIGATAAQMEPLRPWFAALTLSVAPLAKAGYDPASGVELVLKARALEAGKSVHGLETVDKQIRILAGMPEDAQLAFLRSTLEDFDQAVAILDALVTAWAAGDVEALDRLVVQDMKADSPVIHQALLVDRNADWADQIQRMLAGSGTAFIAVGAAHLAGEDSVQAILQQRGVPVQDASR
jgi:hypothetical protein